MAPEEALAEIGILDVVSAAADFHRTKESDRITVTDQPQTRLQRAEKKQRPQEDKGHASEDDFAVLQGEEGNPRELKAPRATGSSSEAASAGRRRESGRDVEGVRSAGRSGLSRRSWTIDRLLAATALEFGLTIATRNTKDFAGTGVKVVNPFDWSAA